MIPLGRSSALFVYGTLMDDRMRRQLLRRPVDHAAAALFGYRRVQNPDAYPYLAADEQARVDGMILRGLTAIELDTLDRYEEEGRLYRRLAVRVRVAGLDYAAFAYVGIPEALRHIRRHHFDGLRNELETAVLTAAPG